MAYNPNLYNPYGQQSYTWYQPLPTMAVPQSSAQPINGLVSVTGIEGAKAYQLPPNSAMPLFDADEDVLYLKTTDSAGYPTIRTFTFKSADELKHMAAGRSDYVQRSEFDALVAQVKEIVGEYGDGKMVHDGE